MRWSKTLTMVEAHAEGEVGRVVTGGFVSVPGETMVAKLDHLNRIDDSIRRFCVFEPRGCAQMSTNLVFPATRPDADVGFVVLQGDKAHAMSGSNAICVTTVLLETGAISMTEPETVVRFDTAVGLVAARAACRDGKCERVTLDMPSGFVEELDVQLDIPELGPVTVDIAFGGIYYALIDPRQLGLSIEPDQGRALVDAGSKIHRAANAALSFCHPEVPSLNALSYVMFVDTLDDGTLIGATVLPPGRLDRSPCGTGNTARMAVRAARNQSRPGDVVTARSIIGSAFNVEFVGPAQVGPKPAIRTRVSGRGWIHGVHQIGLDPSDPFPDGFLLSDTWGDAFDLLAS